MLWGGRSGASPEQHVAASLEAFGIFARESAARALDGFVFEVAEGGGASLDEHARSVLLVLRALSDCDPSGNGGCLAEPEAVGGGTWSFRWAGRQFFVSSFGGCYPPRHPRHACGSRSSFVLVQPSESFTRWRTASQKEAILHGFAARGCPVFYQGRRSAEMVVPPVEDTEVGGALMRAAQQLKDG